MRIELEAHPPVGGSGDFLLRATLFNDSYGPVGVSRNSFVGPNLRPADGMPYPDSVEATFSGPDEPLTLQPFTYYGRERGWTLASGEYEVTATYEPPAGPHLAESIRIRVQDGAILGR